MSRSTVRNQLFINDGLGNKLPIATATWVTNAVNIDEHRRISFTVAITSATGASPDYGAYTGVMLVQGTNELGQCNGATGTQEAGNTNRPGINGFTGARFWQTLPSGTIPITNSVTVMTGMDFTDVGFAYIRLAFNRSATGALPSASACGSGTWNVYLTAKNT